MDLMGSTITIASVLTIIGVLIAVLNYISNRNRNTRKDASEEEARLVRMETMLVNIEKNTSNLNARVNDHDKWLTKHETRLSVIEEKIHLKKGDK